jgi:hypothetical protein
VFVTSHALAGATLGAVIRRPAPAFGIGVLSHVLMDLTPHWAPRSADFLAAARRDGFTGLAAIGVTLTLCPARHRPAVAAGIFGAVLPDMDKPGQHFFGVSPFPAFVDRFHAHIQHESAALLRRELVVGAGLAGVAVAAQQLLRRYTP